MNPITFESLKDDQLVALSKQGHEEATDTLCQRYYPIIRKHCTHYFKNKYDSEDATQNVMCRLFVEKRIHKFKELSTLYHWVRVVTRNTCHMHYRSTRKIKDNCLTEYKSGQFEETLESDVDNPLDKLINEEENKFVLMKIGELSKKYKEALQLRFFQEQSYKEAAKRMGITTANYGLRLNRAIQMLMKKNTPFCNKTVVSGINPNSECRC
jgi:RNA polymerase sigma-70 factor, ECF subfamily